MTIKTDEAADKMFELITFTVGGQNFCMDIMKVREIRGWTDTTILPHAPSFVLGVMNLRGAVVPIIDLAARIGLPPLVPRPRHVILVTQTGDQISGLLVTSVSDIVGTTSSSIQPMPSIALSGGGGIVDGMIVRDGRTFSILNVAGLFSLDQVLTDG